MDPSLIRLLQSFYGQDPYGYGIYGVPSYYPPYPAQYVASNFQRRKPRPPKDNAQMWCDICGVGCIGQQSYTEHCNGKKHQLLARKAQLSGTASVSSSTTPTQSSSSIRYTPYDGGSPPPSNESKSSQGKFYCEICGIYSTDQNTFNLHLTGKKHKTMLLRSGGAAPTTPEAGSIPMPHPLSNVPSFINLPRYNIPTTPKTTFTPMLINQPSNLAEDNLLNSKLEILSPTAENIVPLSNLIQIVLAKLGEFKMDHEGEDESLQPVLLDITMVGPYARGTLIKGHLYADLVVITKHPPDAAMLDFFREALRTVLPDATLEINLEKLGLYARMPDDVFVHLMFTWADALDFEEELPAKPPSPPTSENLAGVNISACQRALLMVRQMQFFSDNSLSPNLRPCLKIMKDLRNRLPVYAPLNNWAIEVIIINALRTVPLAASLSQSLRAIFALIASGMLLPGVEFIDPCAQEAASVVRNLSNQSRLDITEASQKILNDMAFGKWEEILGL